MKALILTISFFFFSQKASFVVQELPSMKCRTIEGLESEFPAFGNSELKVILITIGSKDKNAAESWVNPLVQKFIRRSGMMDLMFDAKLFSLSCLNKTDYLKLNAADKSLMNDFPDELKKVSYFTNESSENLSKAIGGKSSVKVIVVGGKNELLGFVEGEYSDDKLEQIEELIADF